MTFSVVTPVLNGLPSIKRCVGSVRGQRGVEAEHLVHDACSTDGTAEWLSEQLGVSSVSEPDSGMYDAINRGWAHATGDVLCWLNHDEQHLPGSYAYVARVFDAHPKVDVVFGDTIMVDPDGEPLAARREIPLRRSYIVNGFLYALSCSLFFRRQLWDEGILRMNAGFRNSGDADLMIRLLDAGKSVLHVNRYIGLFGIDGNNISLSPNLERECALIRLQYGSLPQPIRSVLMSGRYAEKLFHGCYGTRRMSYAFAVNETPNYRAITDVPTGTAFSYERFCPVT